MDELAVLLNDIISDIPDCRMVTDVIPPVITADSVKKNRELCKRDLCGNYGKSCTCPPLLFSDEECISKVNSYGRADIVSVHHTDLDFKNEGLMRSITSDFQNICRNIVHKVRDKGYDCYGLSEGPCNFCKRCAALDGKECRHPEEQVPSVSGFGVDMSAFLNSAGIEFGFKENEATFYGIILTNTKNK